MGIITIEFNYGGVFDREDTIQYVGGKQEFVDKVDTDQLSIFEFQEMLSEYGVSNWKTLQYWDSHFDLEDGLRMLNSDADILSMVSALNKKLYVKIYVESEIVADNYSREVQNEEEISIHVDENIEIEVASISASLDDELHSLRGSDSDSKEEWAEFSSTVTDVELGMIFTSLAEIKNLVVDYAVQNGHNVKFIKNEKARLTAICEDGCKWRLHASKMHNEATYQIKTYNNVHTCARLMENRHATAIWIVNKYKERFRSQPNWQISSIVETVRQDYNVNINPSLAYRARSKARQLHDGCGKEQYKQLWSYAEEIRRSNPGSTFLVSLDKETNSSPATFERAYVCFHAWKQGLLSSGRPLICLDECHLKGHCPGHLLTTVGIDGNDGIYPIAIAVVESECIASWHWFLAALFMDLHIESGVGWTFISDQQKGLTDVVPRLAPGAEIRYCVRHLYANFKNQFRGKIYKDAMMNASRATTAYVFENEMKKLEAVDRAAYTYLSNIRPNLWARHAFSHVPKCDISLNNLSESFNALILPARDKPIITMFEMIRKMLMARIAKRHSKMAEGTGFLCPRIKKKINKLINSAQYWSSIPAGGDCFEVSDGPMITYIVDLGRHSCSCHAWGLTGIPCVHAVPCVLFMRRNVEDYVHPWYHRQTYLDMYSHFMRPMNGPQRWPVLANMDTIMPPIFKRRPGRPKKKRVRDVDEPRSTNAVSRKNKRPLCSTCHQTGHNARSCQGIANPARAMVVVGSNATETTPQSQTASTSGVSTRGTRRRGRRQSATFMGFRSSSAQGTQGSSVDGVRRP